MELQELCPRCELRYFTAYGKGIATEEAPYPALSRVAHVNICSWCGMHEAVLDYAGEAPIPPDEWPISVERVES